MFRHIERLRHKPIIPPPPPPPPLRRRRAVAPGNTAAQNEAAIKSVTARAVGTQVRGARRTAADDDRLRAAQGATLHAGRTMDKDGRGRSYYNRELKKLAARTDLTGAEARDARKAIRQQTWDRLTPFGRYLSKAAAGTPKRQTQLLHKTDEQLRASAPKSNGFWNRVGTVHRVAGRTLIVAGVVTSAYNITTAPAHQRGRVVTKEVGAWTGALSVGAVGAKGGGLVGLAIGGPVGGVIGAAVGGLAGGAIGAIGGSKVGERLYNWWSGK